MTRSRAVVLGGSLAGMLAASVLAGRAQRVIIVERDRLPDGPKPRNGVPQSHHAHLVLPGGVRSLEALLPGLTDRLLSLGAARLGLPSGVVALTEQGWLPRLPETHVALSCSRGLLEWAVRDRVLRDDRIELSESSDVVRLCGDKARVTGAVVRGRTTGEHQRFDADIVIDATGANSRAPEWLRALGAPEVGEDVVDSGLACSSRLYLAPPDARADFPAVFVRPRPDVGRPEQGGAVLPIEKGQWHVSLSGTRGVEPPTDILGFERLAGDLRHGVIGDLLAKAEPLEAARGYRNNANRRRRFPRAPQGFVAIGDAAVATNPVYAHGVTLAAQAALALRAELDRGRLPRGSARLQREVLRSAQRAWTLATRRDVLYPQALGGPIRGARRRHRLNNRLRRVVAGQPDAVAALVGAETLAGSLARVLSRPVLTGMLRGAPAFGAGDPPFTAEELAALHHSARSIA